MQFRKGYNKNYSVDQETIDNHKYLFLLQWILTGNLREYTEYIIKLHDKQILEITSQCIKVNFFIHQEYETILAYPIFSLITLLKPNEVNNTNTNTYLFDMYRIILTRVIKIKNNNTKIKILKKFCKSISGKKDGKHHDRSIMNICDTEDITLTYLSILLNHLKGIVDINLFTYLYEDYVSRLIRKKTPIEETCINNRVLTKSDPIWFVSGIQYRNLERRCCGYHIIKDIKQLSKKKVISKWYKIHTASFIDIIIPSLINMSRNYLELFSDEEIHQLHINLINQYTEVSILQ